MFTYYTSDDLALAALGDDGKAKFEKWFADLEAEHKRLGSPYGSKSLAETTGVNCWLEFYHDDYSAADALAEDLAHAS